MFAIGLILIILAIIVIAYVIFATRDLEVLTIDWGIVQTDLSPLQLFFLGAVTVLVLSIGSGMLGVGLKRAGAKRAEVKRLRKEVKAQDPNAKQPTKKELKAAAKRGEDISPKQAPAQKQPETKQFPQQDGNTPPPPPPNY